MEIRSHVLRGDDDNNGFFILAVGLCVLLGSRQLEAVKNGKELPLT